MSTSTTMQVSSVRAIGKTFGWILPVVNFLSTFTYINMAGAYLVIHGSRLSLWQTALIVSLMLSGHRISDTPPLNSARMSHLIESACSTFVFGVIMTWLLYPKYIIDESRRTK